MFSDKPALGVRFDVEKTQSDFYVLECWKILWGALKPEDIKGADFYEGDTRATLEGTENVYCIAFQHDEASVINKSSTALLKNSKFFAVSALPAVLRADERSWRSDSRQRSAAFRDVGECYARLLTLASRERAQTPCSAACSLQ
jgi:hypothetical protein